MSCKTILVSSQLEWLLNEMKGGLTADASSRVSSFCFQACQPCTTRFLLVPLYLQGFLEGGNSCGPHFVGKVLFKCCSVIPYSLVLLHCTSARWSTFHPLSQSRCFPGGVIVPLVRLSASTQRCRILRKNLNCPYGKWGLVSNTQHTEIFSSLTAMFRRPFFN